MFLLLLLCCVGYVSISSLCQPHPNMDGIPLSLQEAILYAVNGEKVNDVSQVTESACSMIKFSIESSSQ